MSLDESPPSQQQPQQHATMSSQRTTQLQQFLFNLTKYLMRLFLNNRPHYHTPYLIELAEILFHPEILLALYHIRTCCGHCCWIGCGGEVSKAHQFITPNSSDPEAGPQSNLTTRQIKYLGERIKQIYLSPKTIPSPIMIQSSQFSLFDPSFVPLHCSQHCRESSYRLYHHLYENNTTSLQCQRFSSLSILLRKFITTADNNNNSNNNNNIIRPISAPLESKLECENEQNMFGLEMIIKALNGVDSDQFKPITCDYTPSSPSLFNTRPLPRLIRLAVEVNEFNPILSYPPVVQGNRMIYSPAFGDRGAFTFEFQQLFQPLLLSLHTTLRSTLSSLPLLCPTDPNTSISPEMLAMVYKEVISNELFMIKKTEFFQRIDVPLNPPLPSFPKSTSSQKFPHSGFVLSNYMVLIWDVLDRMGEDVFNEISLHFSNKFLPFEQHFKNIELTNDELTINYNLYHDTVKPYRNRLWHHSTSRIHHQMHSNSTSPSAYTKTPQNPPPQSIKASPYILKNPNGPGIQHKKPLFMSIELRFFLQKFKYNHTQSLRLLKALHYYFPSTPIPTLLAIMKPSFISFNSQGYPDDIPSHIFTHSATSLRDSRHTNPHLPQSGLAPPSLTNQSQQKQFKPDVTKSPYLTTSRPTTMFFSNSEYVLFNPLLSITTSKRLKTFMTPSQFTFRALLRLIQSAKKDYYLAWDLPPKRCNGRERRMVKKMARKAFYQHPNGCPFSGVISPQTPSLTIPTINHISYSSNRLPKLPYRTQPLHIQPITTPSLTSPQSPPLIPLLSLSPPPTPSNILTYLHQHPNEVSQFFLHPRVADFLSEESLRKQRNDKNRGKKGVRFDLPSTNHPSQKNQFDSHIIKHTYDGSNDDSDNDDEDQPIVKMVSFTPVTYHFNEQFYLNSIISAFTHKNIDHIDTVDGTLNPITFTLLSSSSQTALLLKYPFLSYLTQLPEDLIIAPSDHHSFPASTTTTATATRTTRDNNNNNNNIQIGGDEERNQYVRLDKDILTMYQTTRTTTRKTLFPTKLYNILKNITFPFDYINPNKYPPGTMTKGKFNFLLPFIYQLTMGDQLPPHDQIVILTPLYNHIIHNGSDYPEVFELFDKLRQAAITTANKQRSRPQAGVGKFPAHINSSASRGKTVGLPFRDAEAQRYGLREIQIDHGIEGLILSGSSSAGEELITNLGTPTTITTTYSAKPEPQRKWTPPQTIRTDFSALSTPLQREGTRRRPKAVIDATDLWKHPKHLIQLEGHGSIVDTQVGALHQTTMEVERNKRHQLRGEEPLESERVKEFKKEQLFTPVIVGDGEIQIPAYQFTKQYREYGELSQRVKTLQAAQDRMKGLDDID